MTRIRPLAQRTAAARETRASRFRLLRYFSSASLVAFLVVAGVLYFLERKESEYFREVQREQRELVAGLQAEFARVQKEVARRDLLVIHEAGHVNMTKLVANVLWDSHLEPFLASAQRIPVDHCRSAVGGASKDAGAPSSAAAECVARVRREIMALAEFPALDAKIADTMAKSTVFKVKVFDRRGVTVYSSEHAQIGEDKRENQGWREAIAGQPASELTHRDTLSTFEHVVEHRDLISSYVPVVTTEGGEPVAVFEIYSDVTPFLGKLGAALAENERLAAARQVRLDEVAKQRQSQVDASSRLLLAILGALLMVLYVVLLIIVRYGQRILDAQARAQEESIRRDERSHRDKMSALATMAATVSHEIGNPLATITALADDVAERAERGEDCRAGTNLIVEQAERIAARTRQIADFVGARREVPEAVDVNELARTVCEFMSFDRRFRTTNIEFRPGDDVPARTLVPDRLTEVLMDLLQAPMNEEVPEQPPRHMLVETQTRGRDVLIRITCDGAGAMRLMAIPGADSPLEPTQRRVASMGAGLASNGDAIEIILPPGVPLPAAP